MKYTANYIPFEFEGKHYCFPAFAIKRPVVKAMKNGKLFEPETHQFVKKVFNSFSGSMIHAGAFFGDMIPNFSAYVSPGYVYAFEPELKSYILSNLCVERNNIENVFLFRNHLSSSLENKNLLVRSKGQHRGGSVKLSEKGNTISTGLKIDNLMIDDLVMIQLDVEEHELPALQGAEDTIKRCRPIIVIEDNLKNCPSYLKDMGYLRTGNVHNNSVWCPKENSEYLDLIGKT
jgi:FkbM family methyltransferase